MANKPYNAIDHALYLTTFNGITFVAQGEPDLDFIAVSYVNDATTASEGAKGDVQFSQRVASLGTIVFTCQWGSPTNDNLNQVFEDQQAGNIMLKAEVKRISNTENTVVWTSINPKITKIPDYATGVEASNRGWNFMVERLKAGEKLAPA